MKDKWYGDNRDIVKWGVLLELSQKFKCDQILQVLYYRAASIQIDGANFELRREIVEHFRDVSAISALKCGPKVKLLKDAFGDRTAYLETIAASIRSLDNIPAVIFLDPDTGLEPASGKFDDTHVRTSEIERIWEILRRGDVLVFYQHQDNRSGSEWIQRKRSQFADALGYRDAAECVGLAYAPEIAKDVAFYFLQKA